MSASDEAIYFSASGAMDCFAFARNDDGKFGAYSAACLVSLR